MPPPRPRTPQAGKDPVWRCRLLVVPPPVRSPLPPPPPSPRDLPHWRVTASSPPFPSASSPSLAAAGRAGSPGMAPSPAPRCPL
eukprot:4018538-Pleurochrysis_carterae.AAC.1